MRDLTVFIVINGIILGIAITILVYSIVDIYQNNVKKLNKCYIILLTNTFDKHGKQLYLTKNSDGEYVARPFTKELKQVFTYREILQDSILKKYSRFKIEMKET